MSDAIPHPVEHWLGVIERLGASGVVVSLAYGPCGYGDRLLWSVDMLNKANDQSLKLPMAAESFKHACWIAQREAKQRGWIV